MCLQVDAQGPIPVRQPRSELLEHAIQGGGVPRDHTRPSIRELVGFLDSNPNTAARAIEDLKRSGYRPLRPGPEAPEPSFIPGRPPSKGTGRGWAVIR
jgi:DNA-binding transcriptional regulator YhcF (GntR family)